MNLRLKSWVLFTALAAGLVSGCAQTRLRIQDDFGRAVNEDLTAQIADPDAGRDAGPPPPSSGARAVAAVERYRQDAVIQPSSVGASGSAPGYGANTAAQPTSAPTTGMGASGASTGVSGP
jgi:hypothetical protein